MQPGRQTDRQTHSQREREKETGLRRERETQTPTLSHTHKHRSHMELPRQSAGASITAAPTYSLSLSRSLSLSLSLITLNTTLNNIHLSEPNAQKEYGDCSGSRQSTLTNISCNVPDEVMFYGTRTKHLTSFAGFTRHDRGFINCRHFNVTYLSISNSICDNTNLASLCSTIQL